MSRPALVGTPAKTQLTSGVGGVTIATPAGIQPNECVVVAFVLDDPNKTVAATSYTMFGNPSDSGADTGRQVGFLIKRAVGGEGTTLGLTWSGTASVAAIAARFDPCAALGTPNAAGLLESTSEDPYTFAANQITGVGGDSIVLFAWGEDSKQRTVSAKDAALTLVGNQVSGTSGDHSLHFYYEATPGSGNAAYSNDMNSSARWLGVVAELVGTSGGGGGGAKPYRYYQNMRQYRKSEGGIFMPDRRVVVPQYTPRPMLLKAA